MGERRLRVGVYSDLVYRSDGAIYFSDPNFGLPRFADDPRKELPFAGVFRAKDGDVQLIFNTTEGWQSLQDSQSIRASALAADVAYYTTAAASDAATHAIGALRAHSLEVKPLQDYY